jgi:Flp pilus assembly pilin Flp
MRLSKWSQRFLGDESGMTAVEYAVLAAFVVLVCVGAMIAFKAPAGSALERSGSNIGTYSDP